MDQWHGGGGSGSAPAGRSCVRCRAVQPAALECLAFPRAASAGAGPCGRPGWRCCTHYNANQSHSASAMALPRQYGADQGSMAMPSRRHTGPARSAPSTALGKPYGSTGTYAMDAPGIGPDAVHVTGPQPPGREQRAGAHRAQRIGGGQRGQRRQQRRQDEDTRADGEPAQVPAMAGEPRHGLEADHRRDREEAGKPRAGSSDTQGPDARNETPGRGRVFRWLPTWPCPGRRPPRRRGPPLPDRPDSGARPPSARRPARTAAGCRWECSVRGCPRWRRC